METVSIELRIVLESPPPGVDFGIQHGRGSRYETILKQRSAAGRDVIFEFSLPLKPNLTGPLVQGPPGARFVYVDIGRCAGQADSCWSRRLKVPLAGIDLSAGADGVWEARIPGTAKDGGPSCATVKPPRGWQLKKRGA